MKRFVLLVTFVSVVAGMGAFAWARGVGEQQHRASAVSGMVVSEVGDSPHGPKLKAGSRRSLGVFDLGRGRSVRLSTGDTTDGTSCLIEYSEEDPGGSMCLENGLFELRKVAFYVSSQGGPERFTELYVPGVVAPGIRSAELVKTDGSTVSLALNGEGAFLFESPPSELADEIYPSGFRLYGPSGKLVETVSFPPGA